MVIAQLDPAVTHMNSSHCRRALALWLARCRALALCLAGRRRPALALPRMPPSPFRQECGGGGGGAEGGGAGGGGEAVNLFTAVNQALHIAPTVSETAGGGVSIHSSVRPVSVRYHLD